MAKSERIVNPHEKLIAAANENSSERSYSFSWKGVEDPKRIVIIDPTDPNKEKKLFDFKVDYMKDGIIITPDNILVGTYRRIVDAKIQEDGSYLNEIQFSPLDHDGFITSLLS